MEEKTLNNPVKLTSVTRLEAEMIANMLGEYEIPCYVKDQESGGYMNIYMGFSVYGSEIYVKESDLEKAKILLNQQAQISGAKQDDETDKKISLEVTGNRNGADEDSGEEEDDWIADEDISRSKLRAVMAIVGIGFIAVGVSILIIRTI